MSDPSNHDQQLSLLKREIEELREENKQLSSWFHQLDSAHDRTVEELKLFRQAIRDLRTLINKGAQPTVRISVPKKGAIQVQDHTATTVKGRIRPATWDGNTTHRPTPPENLCTDCAGQGTLLTGRGPMHCACRPEWEAAMMFFKSLQKDFMKKIAAERKAGRASSRKQ